MPDYFALLQQPRRPWIDADLLKEHFRATAATQHPDVAGAAAGDAFAEVNAAFTTLRDPVSRVRHLLELDFPGQMHRVQSVPSGLSEHFMRIAAFRQRLEKFRVKRAATSSPLAAALLADEQQSLRTQSEQSLLDLGAAEQRTLADLRDLDAEWNSGDEACGQQLAALYQRLSYLAKWASQLREDQFALGA